MLHRADTTIHRPAGWHSVINAPGPTDKTTFNKTSGDIEDYDATDTSYYVNEIPRFRNALRYEIDTSRLILEWLMVILLTVGLTVAFRSARRREAS